MILLRSIKRHLRSPRLIVGEIAAIALFGVLGAALPQSGVASAAELERFRAGGPLWTVLVKTFALDHIFRSAGFAALTVLASASLVVVVLEQLRRARVQWSQRLAPAHFQSAPFRVEFERAALGTASTGQPSQMLGGRGPFPLTPTLSPGERENQGASREASNRLRFADRLARILPFPVGEGRGDGEQGSQLAAGTDKPKPSCQCLVPADGAGGARVKLWTEKRLGLLGSPLFHVGLLLVIAAGTWRALFGAEAGVDLLEGETLAPTAQAWAAHWPGLLARPFHLDAPVTLNSVHATCYESGELRDLKVRVAIGRTQGVAEAEIAVNHDAGAAGGRLFLTSDFGPAALLEWQPVHGAPMCEALLLKRQGGGSFESASAGPNGERAYLRAEVDAAGNPPPFVEVRVMKDGALLAVADARPGETILLPGGTKLAVRGTPFWARLRGGHDSALWLAYLGFALVMAGATLIFTVVKLDGCIVVTPLGECERVLIALKPQRFAPLFQERFERLVEDQGGRASPRAQTAAEKRARVDARPPSLTLACRLRSRLAGWLFLLLCGTLLTSCKQSPAQQARTLVERYNRVVSEAYRRGDVRLIDPVVGPKEGKKLTGLIGVRLDFGITLDSHLLSLEVLGVEQSKAEMRVRTKERWRYRDLKIGTGEQVGDESLDSYEMLYLFTNINKAWLVDEIRFTTPPWVGRKQTPWVADRKATPPPVRPAAQPEHAHP